jgi:hypothetical protein
LSRRVLLYTLLAIAAAARLLLAVAAMPPYAGLDEVYHVARLAFVGHEHRQPASRELSFPRYLSTVPNFAHVGRWWPEAVANHPRMNAPHPNADMQYVAVNYEAQQPSLYYALAAPLRGSTDVGELRSWRLLSAVFGLIVVLAAATMLERWLGTRGILAAALIVSFPTWITLVVRAGNDALACALLAVALAVTASNPKRGWAEALAWAGAVAVKLYTWPVAAVVPLFWWKQKAPRARIAVVVLAAMLAAGLTMADLSKRTANPLGHFGFDKPAAATAAPQPIAYRTMMKIAVASGIWTSGQHNDALTAKGMLLYALPLLLIALLSTLRLPDYRLLQVVGVAVVAFGAAQLVDAAAFIRQARAAGLALPLGGKEGWYWYALAPLGMILFASLPRLAGVWIVVWDVVITEGALFHDYAGLASPNHPSMLFRWGPWQRPFTADLAAIGVGPLAAQVTALRIVHVAALLALFVMESVFARELEHEQ